MIILFQALKHLMYNLVLLLYIEMQLEKLIPENNLQK